MLNNSEIINLKKALEKINQEYYELNHSREYKIGSLLLNSLSFTPKRIIDSIRMRKKVKNCGKFNQKVNYLNSSKRNYLETYGKTVVYTCVTRNYDTVRDPLYVPENVDFILFTEKSSLGTMQQELKTWKIYELPEMPNFINTPAMMNRYLKLHPHEFFESYDYSIYIDGNVRVIGDICSLLCNTNCETGLAFHRHRQRKSVYFEAEVCKLLGKGNSSKIENQMKKYKMEGFPDDFGLYEATVIATDLNNDTAIKLLNAWWSELVNSQSGRDQLSLPYIVWKNGYKYESIGNLGNNLYDNRIFQIISHR